MSVILVNAPRIRDRQPVIAEIHVVYQDDRPAETLPRLYLFSDWSERKGDWRTRDSYRVEEIPTAGGRGFMLQRSAEAIARDAQNEPHAEPDTFYGVFIAVNGQDHTCTCRGFQAHCRCKHHDAVRGLLESGHIDHAEAGRPYSPADLNSELAPF